MYYIGVKMVEAVKMNAAEAKGKGYNTSSYEGSDEGYEVTYEGGYKSWSPKDVFETYYFPIDNRGFITISDVDRYMLRTGIEAIPEVVERNLEFVRQWSILGLKTNNNNIVNRLKKEKEEVDKKIDLISKFLESYKIEMIPSKMLELKKQQLSHMTNYSNCLKAQIEELQL